MRRHLAFGLEEERLIATLDAAPGVVGLLIVSGGSQTRAGAFAGQARLAATIAAAGHPVWRYDRRGVGDSTGTDGGFRASVADIHAALAAFRRAAPHMRRVVGYGNCDAAAALMLARGAGCDALVLANPWTIDENEEEGEDRRRALPPPAALRARYAAKLRSAGEWRRLFAGQVDLGRLAAGLRAALRPSRPPPAGALVEEMRAGLEGFGGAATILLAGADRTAQIFASRWPAADPRLVHLAGADHGFSAPDHARWLSERILAALQEQARQLDMG